MTQDWGKCKEVRPLEGRRVHGKAIMKAGFTWLLIWSTRTQNQQENFPSVHISVPRDMMYSELGVTMKRVSNEQIYRQLKISPLLHVQPWTGRNRVVAFETEVWLGTSASLLPALLSGDRASASIISHPQSNSDLHTETFSELHPGESESPGTTGGKVQREWSWEFLPEVPWEPNQPGPESRDLHVCLLRNLALICLIF